ncbi:nose resistant to fluoxetine protein 6-like [Brevipalpus obovatus]|uniref:nose resistant to fluoxetine protein 6-like n=1 Tax=Brevipalpus obovatus TaxID=246614 RepID=UPI003D9EF2FA
MVQVVFLLCCLITFLDPLSAYQPRIRTEINAKSTDLDKINLFNYYLDWWLPMIDNALHELNQNTNQSQISFLCKRHVNHVIKSAKKQVPWALKMFDSFGKPTSGLMQVDLSFLGSYSECLDISPEGVEPQFTGQYCLATFNLPDSAISTLQRISGLAASSLSNANTKLGLCVPSTCKMDEIKLITDKVFSKIVDKTSAVFSTCYNRSSTIENGSKAYIFLSFIVLIVGMVLLGTVYDYHIDDRKSGVKLTDRSFSMAPVLTITHSTSHPSLHSLAASSMTKIHHVEKKKQSSVSRVLLAFSAKSNLNRILDTSEADSSIRAIHGLRVISMFWIIGGHSYSFGMQWLFFQNSHLLGPFSRVIINQVLANTNFSVDCFFFVSGLLVAHSMIKELKKNNRINLIKFYLHRYIRMTPLMMVIIGFCATVLRYLGQGPAWLESIMMFDKWCEDNWWINALYLHNFVKRETMCLSHSWYSAVDMQLYLISPFIILPLFYLPILGWLIVFGLLIGSFGITAYLTVVNHFPPVPYLNIVISQEVLNNYYGSIYIKPWCRLGPYVVGIILGYLIQTLEHKINLKKRYIVLGWISAVTLNAGILLAMIPADNGYYVPSDLEASLYSATSRTLWAVGLAWIVFACVNGKGGFVNHALSWKPLIPLSKLTYCAYLIHPVVIATFYGSRETTFHFSHYLMVYFILGNIFITYLVSLILSVFFELPLIMVDRAINRKR